jgi:hypothetical protein
MQGKKSNVREEQDRKEGNVKREDKVGEIRLKRARWGGGTM